MSKRKRKTSIGGRSKKKRKTSTKLEIKSKPQVKKVKKEETVKQFSSLTLPLDHAVYNNMYICSDDEKLHNNLLTYINKAIPGCHQTHPRQLIRTSLTSMIYYQYPPTQCHEKFPENEEERGKWVERFNSVYNLWRNFGTRYFYVITPENYALLFGYDNKTPRNQTLIMYYNTYKEEFTKIFTSCNIYYQKHSRTGRCFQIEGEIKIHKFVDHFINVNLKSKEEVWWTGPPVIVSPKVFIGSSVDCLRVNHYRKKKRGAKLNYQLGLTGYILPRFVLQLGKACSICISEKGKCRFYFEKVFETTRTFNFYQEERNESRYTQAPVEEDDMMESILGEESNDFDSIDDHVHLKMNLRHFKTVDIGKKEFMNKVHHKWPK